MEFFTLSRFELCPCKSSPEVGIKVGGTAGKLFHQGWNPKVLSSLLRRYHGDKQVGNRFDGEGRNFSRLRTELKFIVGAAWRLTARIESLHHCPAVPHRGRCKMRVFARESHGVECPFPGARLTSKDKRKVSVYSSKDGDYEDSSEFSLPPALEEVLDYLKLDDQVQQGFTNERSRELEDAGDDDADMGVQDGYVGLFVRLLGLDNAAEDREEAVQALWRHSAGGKDFIDEIIAFPGCLNLIVSLLLSERPASGEAAAGLLRNISSVDVYRSAVAEAGAVEEVVGLLTRRSICPEVKEQAMRVLWNLSTDEGPRKKLVQQDILQVLLQMLGSNLVNERESAAGVIANLTLTSSSCEVLVAAGSIPKLASILLNDSEESKVVRQETRDALLELGKDESIKVLLIDEGLVLVPSIGASAYRSFKPLLQVASPLPEDVKVTPAATKVESKFGAGELLIGLNVGNVDIDDSTRLTMEGRVRQQFLARIGVLGKKLTRSERDGDDKFTLLPWWDGIPRLILILGLDDLAVARQAALVIAEIAINKNNREALQKGGSIPHLVRLLGCGDEDATEAAALALDKLAIDQQIRKSISAHDAASALVAILRAENAPDRVKAKVVCALSRLSQSGEDLEALGNGQLSLSADITPGAAIPALLDLVQSEKIDTEAKEEVEEILEEMSNLGTDSRDKIISAGGLHPLIEIMKNGSPKAAQEATCVLENIVNGRNAAEIMDADVQSAIASLLRIGFQDVSAELCNGKAISKEDGCSLTSVASRLLEKLARYLKVDTSLFVPLLIKLLQDDVPLGVRDWISACLFRLDQGSHSAADPLDDGSSDIEFRISETIPWLVKEMGEDFSSTVRERAVIHLRQLVSQGEKAYAASIIEVGGIPSLAKLLTAGQSAGQGAAVAILYNLSMIEGNHSKVLDAGVVPSLIELVQKRIPEWKMALYLLRLLHS